MGAKSDKVKGRGPAAQSRHMAKDWLVWAGVKEVATWYPSVTQCGVPAPGRQGSSKADGQPGSLTACHWRPRGRFPNGGPMTWWLV
jgi:hypothetical protein